MTASYTISVAFAQEVRRIAAEVGRFISMEQKRLTRGGIEEKGKNDFVTYVDKAAESLIVGELIHLLPSASFLTEEKTIAPNPDYDEYLWIIDPIDGTTNFIHALPCYSISIALQHLGNTIFGLVYDVSSKEAFWSVIGEPAFLNEQTIKVSNTPSLADALLVTGFPYRHGDLLDRWMELFKHFIRHTHGVRRLGSAAIDLAYVACGRFEAFYEYGLSPWDVAAGAFIVQQAGGKVSDFKLGKDFIYGKELLATNAAVHQALHTDIQRYLFGIQA